MTRRMSCSMTTREVRARIKTVTRRHADTWRNLKPGDHLILVEKAMGLPKGAKQVVLAEVEVVDVRLEPLHLVDEDEVKREGFDCDPTDFIAFWLEGHHVTSFKNQDEFMAYEVRRIEWRYLDDVAPVHPSSGA